MELSAAQFDYFSKNLLSDYDFLLTNIDCMYQDGDGVSHCLLVLGEGRDDGIIVNSEGSAYTADVERDIHVSLDGMPEDVADLIAVARGEQQNQEFDYTMKL